MTKTEENKINQKRGRTETATNFSNKICYVCVFGVRVWSVILYLAWISRDIVVYMCVSLCA